MMGWLPRLVGLFPAEFRRQFGADMVQHVEDDYRRAAAAGRWSGCRFALATAWDLALCALKERWCPSLQLDPRKRREGEGRRAGMTVDGWRRDLSLALRGLRRAPGFTAVAVLTLGLAIGSSAGLFSVVDRVLLDPLPYPESERLVHIAASAPGTDFPEEFGVGSEFLVQYAEESELLESVSSYDSFTSTLRVGDRVERVRMSHPSLAFFETLGVQPRLGRLPVAGDGEQVAVLSHAAWASWFGSDPAVLGRVCSISGELRTVIGVMGPEFWFLRDDVMLWYPDEVRAEEIDPGRFGSTLVGRTVPGVSHGALAEELTRLARRLPERFGGSARYAELIDRHRAVVRPLEERFFGEVARPLWLLFGALCIVVLIACANVANLFIVRGEHRQRELAVRHALGARRGALVRALMAEALVIAALAGALAVGLAWAGVPALVGSAPGNVPRLGMVGVSASVLLFTAGASLFAALACGLFPAIRASRPDPGGLREAGRGSTGGRHWLRTSLVVGQTALALVLLIGSGLLYRSFSALRAVDPGYDARDVFTFQFAPERQDLVDGPSWAAFHLDFAERLRALPGVEAVGIVENVPLNEGVRSEEFVSEEHAADADGGALVSYTFTAEDYFEAMGIDVAAGRTFEAMDHLQNPGHVLVSRSAADLLWPGQDPVGRRVRPRDRQEERWDTVIGVVGDVLQYDFRDTPLPMMYFPLAGTTPDAYYLPTPGYVVKTHRAEQIAPEIRAAVREVAPLAPMYRVFTMERLVAQSMARLSFTLLTLAVASGMALLLGSIGLFGVLSYVVSQRTREIGLRMALGAEARNVQGMVVRQGVGVVLIGVALGLLSAIGGTRVLDRLLFGVEAVDLPTFVMTSAAMVAIGAVASYLPARRASLVDPMESLRSD